MPTQRYIMLKMVENRDLWGVGSPRSRRGSAAELRRRSSVGPAAVPHLGASSASTHRPVGKLHESTSDLSLLASYVGSLSYGPQQRNPDAMPINARAVPDSVLVRSRKAGSKISLAGSDGVGADILATDDFIAEEMEIQGDDEDVLVEGDSVLSEDEEELAEGRWQLPKEFMFLVSSFIVLFTSGGLILGFGPMYSMLVRENQWSELCSEEERKDAVSGNVLCAAQEIRLQYVFSTGFLCLSAANAFFGVFIDVVGPRLTIMLSLTLSALGNFALGFGDSHTGNGAWIIIGYSLVGAGGMGSYLAAFQILQLYQVQGVVCSTLSSLFNCSGYVYMLLGVQGVTRLGFFQVYGVLVSACTFVCFLLFPTNNVTKPRDFLAIPLCRLEAPRINAPTGLLDGMREEIKRPDLWFFAILFGWISLIFAFAGGAIPSLLVKLAGKDTRAASLFTNFLYPVLVNGTFVYSPLVGYAIDRYGFKVIFAACIILVQLFIALLLVPSLRVQLFMFFVYAMAQACLYALQFAYVIMCFPAELYGTLQAFLATVSFSFGLLNYLINPWTQTYLDGDYTLVLLLLGLPTIALYAFIHVVEGCEDQTVRHEEDGKVSVAGEIPREHTRLL